MNPNSDETPGLQFPMPEQVSNDPASLEAGGVAAVPEQASASGQGAVPAVPPNDAMAATQAVSTTIADDGDLIEKEWVNKAKHIVESTRNDPYKQSEELTAFKADYMKKRYGKDIKLSK